MAKVCSCIVLHTAKVCSCIGFCGFSG